MEFKKILCVATMQIGIRNYQYLTLEAYIRIPLHRLECCHCMSCHKSPFFREQEKFAVFMEKVFSRKFHNFPDTYICCFMILKMALLKTEVLKKPLSSQNFNEGHPRMEFRFLCSYIVSHCQTTFSCRTFIACSISACTQNEGLLLQNTNVLILIATRIIIYM